MENLKPDTGDLTVKLLVYISSQLNNVSMPAYTPQPFVAEQPYVIANALCFASLAVLLVTSLLAMLVKGWVRDFNQNLPPHKLAEKRAKEREYRFRGLIAHKMPEIVASIPILIQIALILFCAALLIYLNQADVHIMIATGCIFAAGLLFYFLTTIIAVYDSSAPFPSPLSRFLIHTIQWINHFPSRMMRWIERCRSTYTYHTFRVLYTSLPRRLSTILRKRRWALVSSRSSGKSTDLELHVVNRLANETLVAPENVRTFTVMLQYLALHSRLRPIGRQEWRDIISTVCTVDLSAHLLTTRGILRVVMFAYAPAVDGSDALLNLASALLEIDKKPKPVPIPLPTGPEKQEFKRPTPVANLVPSNGTEIRDRPYTTASAMSAARALEPENGGGENELENTSLVPLSPLQLLVQKLKHAVFSMQDWPTVIEDQEQIEEIAQELLWLADFFQSSLCCALDKELRSKLMESGIQSTQDLLVLASWLPTEVALPLVSAGIRIGLALKRLDDGTPSVEAPEERKGGREQYFSVADRPSTDPETICSNLVALLDPLRSDGHLFSLCLSVVFALWHLDPLSSLLSVHKRKGKLDPISKLAGVEPAALDHFSILNFVINSIPRKRIQGTFMTFMECWDQLAKDPVIPLKEECLRFFEMMLKRLQPEEGSLDDPPLGDEDWVIVMKRSEKMQNPWIILAGDPIRQAEAYIPDDELAAERMEQTPWIGDERYEHIVRDNLEFYCTTNNRDPYLPILVLFEQSSELQSYLQALCLSSHEIRGGEAKGSFTETRVARFTKIASCIFKEERTPAEILENYLVLHTELFAYYGVLLPEVQRIATVFKQEGGLQWLPGAYQQLAIEVHKLNLADSHSVLADVPSDQTDPLKLKRRRMVSEVVSDTYRFLGRIIPQFASQLASSDVPALQALLTLPICFGSSEQRKRLEVWCRKHMDGY
jgi:hypothetical protein